MKKQNKILREVESYYSEKIRIYGSTPKGVDWNSRESQEIRFHQLTKIIKSAQCFNLLDFGSGYGALYEFLQANFRDFKYIGYDISTQMTQKGKELFGERDLTWKNELLDTDVYDYVIASGIFNVKMENTEKDWLFYIHETLDELNRCAIHGFSFNMLTSYSDREFMKDNLYYAEPEVIFAHCKNKYSSQVALLHDYGLYEFTILVRK